MVHYNLLKLKEGADAAAILAQCQAVYAALEAELPFLQCSGAHSASNDMRAATASFRPCASATCMGWLR